jgi:hypothetical protein
VLARCELEPPAGPPEVARRRSITISPSRGGRIVLRERSRPHPAQAPERLDALAA